MTAVELLIEARTRPVGQGSVRRLLPFRRRRMVGPFIFCDLSGPEELAPGVGMNVDAHPHIGLSTLTYLWAGRAVHRDSTGAVQTIEAGAVNWMTAGSGVTHTERSHPDDLGVTTPYAGAQFWVALPDGAEDGPPGFEHCPADQVPTETRAGVQVRVPVGEALGMAAPIAGSSPLALIEVTLRGGSLTVPVVHPERAVLAVGPGVSLDGMPLADSTLAVLTPGSAPTLTGSGTAMILAGEPIGPRTIWWNFVHSDPERIEAAKQDWLHQRFPTVPGDHDPYVPLPT